MPTFAPIITAPGGGGSLADAVGDFIPTPIPETAPASSSSSSSSSGSRSSNSILVSLYRRFPEWRAYSAIINSFASEFNVDKVFLAAFFMTKDPRMTTLRPSELARWCPRRSLEW